MAYLQLFNRIMDHYLGLPAIHQERRMALETAEGAVLEIGIGTGLNLPAYPPEVERVVAVGPEDEVDPRVVRRARTRGLDVDYRAGTAEELPFSDGHFDTAVSTFVLCTVSDAARAAGEIFRVLKPGGQLLFLEHVVRPRGLGRAAQTALEPLNRLVARGCSLRRDTADTLSRAGFVLESIDTHDQPSLLWPYRLVIRGLARRPAAA